MIATNELSGLLADLYAAPLEPERWQNFMGTLCRLLHISCGYLIGKHPEAGSSTLLAGGGPNFVPEMFALYNQYYAAQDPYQGPLLASPRTGYIEGDSLYDRTKLVHSEIYNDFLRPHQLESTNLLMANCTNTQLEGISLWRGPKQEPLEEDARKLLALLLPHVQMALRLRGQVLLHETERVFTEAALDRVATTALLVTAEGRVLHLNRRAASLLEKNDGLLLRNGRLVAGTASETVQLAQILKAATFDCQSPAPGGAMRVRRRFTNGWLDVSVIPAPRENRITGDDCYALVFVSDPAAKPVPRGTFLRQLYRLTPTESRLADLLLQGVEMNEIAERMATTLGTARFHLKRVLAKTATRRQSELVRLMLALPGDKP